MVVDFRSLSLTRRKAQVIIVVIDFTLMLDRWGQGLMVDNWNLNVLEKERSEMSALKCLQMTAILLEHLGGKSADG